MVEAGRLDRGPGHLWDAASGSVLFHFWSLHHRFGTVCLEPFPKCFGSVPTASYEFASLRIEMFLQSKLHLIITTLRIH